MTIRYEQLSSAERATIMTMLAGGAKQSEIARHLGRRRSTISRELERNGSCADLETGARQPYDAMAAQARRDEQLAAPRKKKLAEGSVLLDIIRKQIREGLSPEQIAGVLKSENPDDRAGRVCHETIYTAIYVMAKGDLRSELVACLRQQSGKRRPRSKGKDRARIPGMTSIHLRPPEVEDRVVPGHWEGDLIKGKANKSAVGTLVERTSRLVKLVKMPGLCSRSALEAFTAAFAGTDGGMARTLTYDRGIEMARHAELTAATGVKVYFADPYSPWQRGSNENINGLVRDYLPKGMDLSTVTQEELDWIAAKLNRRPRKMHNFRAPIDIFEEIAAAQRDASS